jgi:hypothetical protein
MPEHIQRAEKAANCFIEMFGRFKTNKRWWQVWKRSYKDYPLRIASLKVDK